MGDPPDRRARPERRAGGADGGRLGNGGTIRSGGWLIDVVDRAARLPSVATGVPSIATSPTVGTDRRGRW